MKLRHLYLGLEGSDLQEYKSDFLFKTHFLTNWIQKRIRKEKIETPDFNLLFVVGSTQPSERSHFAHENSWNCPIEFNLEEYLNCNSDSDFIKLFYRMLNKGIDKTEKDTSLDLSQVKLALNEFSEINFQNKWKHKSKKLGKNGLTATLYAELDINEFRLSLEISNSKGVLLEKVIKTTKPAIMIFRNYLKEIDFQNEILKIQDGYGNTMYQNTLDELEKLCLT